MTSTPHDRDYGTRLRRARDAALSGGAAQVEIRPPIRASWRRLLAAGRDPGQASGDAFLPREGIERARISSGLLPVIDLLRAHLRSAVDDAGQVMVVADARGRVLWREGSRGAVGRADSLGFMPGSSWNEHTVGTNAIGTALVVGQPLHVHAEEHFAEDHTRWTCAAAPLRDPLDGRMLGIVDVSGPVTSAHPHTLPMVALAARTAQLELNAAREAVLAPLRALAAGVFPRLDGAAIVVDSDGAVAAAQRLAPPRRVRLPLVLGPGVVHLADLGWMEASPLGGGWLLRPHRVGSGTPQVTVELRADRGELVVVSSNGSCTHRLSPRHADLVAALIERPEGWSAAEMAARIFGDAGKTVSIRAEMSRLRRAVGPLLDTRPYRWSGLVAARVVGR